MTAGSCTSTVSTAFGCHGPLPWSGLPTVQAREPDASLPTRMEPSHGDAAAYDGPAGRARNQSPVAYGRRAPPRLGQLDVADFHLRDAGAERDPRGLDLLPEGLRLRLQVGGVLVGPDPNELVLRPMDPGRHDRPADLVMERLGLLFEVLDEDIQQQFPLMTRESYMTVAVAS